MPAIDQVPGSAVVSMIVTCAFGLAGKVTAGLQLQVAPLCTGPEQVTVVVPLLVVTWIVTLPTVGVPLQTLVRVKIGALGVIGTVGVGVAVGVGVTGVGVGVTGVGVAVGVSVGVAVGVSVGVAVGVSVGVAVGVSVGVAVGVSVGVAVGVSVGVAVGVSVGVAVGVSVGVAVGVSVGVAVGVSVGVAVGVFVGVAVGVAVLVGVGVFVGVGVGCGPFQQKITWLRSGIFPPRLSGARNPVSPVCPLVIVQVRPGPTFDNDERDKRSRLVINV